MNGTDPAAELAWTGERLVTTCDRPLVFEHVHRYAIACALAEGKRVLDIACGEGYGANLLGRIATKVVGVDLDPTTIEHARRKYRDRNLEFLVGDCLEIPCADASFDLVASFETIEHIADHERFLSEIKRVLAPGGIVLISSPDKAAYRAVSAGGNPFHQAELTHGEFLRLLEANFQHYLAAKQRLVVGSWIAPDTSMEGVVTGTFRGGVEKVSIEPGVSGGIYSLALCSDAPLPILTLGVFEDERLTAEVWHLLDRVETPAQIEATLQQAEATLQQAHATLQQAHRDKAELERQITAAAKAFEEKAHHVTILQAEIAEKTRQVHHFKEESEHRARLLDRSQLEARLSEERLARLTHELMEAQWDLLSLRGGILGGNYSSEIDLDVQNRAEVAESERDTLRGMVHQLQSELEARSNELHLLQQRVRMVINSPMHKMILPFSSPQRKLRRLARLQLGE
jgi:2-polyprenyl-3-methyl-5-hydroxy-6-metoxy-1,4-benzoquinol methylase